MQIDVGCFYFIKDSFFDVIDDPELMQNKENGNKRPLNENIKKIEKVGQLPNVELHILSICRKNFQIEEKNTWLDKYAPFFNRQNRTIISKEMADGSDSADLKANYLKSIVTDKQIILLDDDNVVLKRVMDRVNEAIVFQDSELID